MITLVILMILGVVFYLLWIIIPAFSGLPWIPTQRQRIRKALQLAKLSPGEIFYDLGSGDGRVLILAAREHGAHAIGVEISPLHCIYAWMNAFVCGVHNQVEIKWASFYQVNFNNADVVFVYMTAGETSRLRPRLEKFCKPGTRVITVSCGIDGWLPASFIRDDLLFLYVVPSPQ